MDALDRLQSGLFFQRFNAIESTRRVPQNPTTSRTKWMFRKISASLSTGSTSAYPPPPSTINDSLPEIPFPLLSVSVDVDIHGRLCTTKVTQQFSNASASTTQNVKYVFPIYDGWAVTSFRCWIGTDKFLEGAVKAKEEARADFSHAVSQRKAAVLVEELAPEVFETNVGNIPAQNAVKIEITYVNLLKIDNSTGGLVLTIPTSIAPRYGLPPAGYTSNQPLPEDGLRVNVQASMPAAIRKIESRSHPISVEMGKASHTSFKDWAAGVSSERVDYTKGQATLSDKSALLDKDFVLHILCGSREALRSRAIAATQPSQQTRSTIAVTINPGDLFRHSADVVGFDGEIIFMADRSGSMQSKISSLANVMNIFLRSLPERCSFNIASFGSHCTWLWPSSQRYSQATLDIASKHIGSFQADYGGTEIYGALETVLEHHNKRSDTPTSVILVTDGEAWDVDNVIRLARTTASDKDLNIRFFSLGIGDRVSHRLVEGIGQQGGGYAEVVAQSGMGSWQERVIQMLKAALTPSRLQCAVDLDQNHPMKTFERKIAGCQVRCPEFIQAPHHIPLLNTFSDLVLYYMVEGGLDSLPKAINVTATTEKGETLTAQLPVHPVAEQSAIHHLAAKALINDYETQQSWLHLLNPLLKSTNPAGFDDAVRQAAQHLGRTWCIPSQWTSYVAIDCHTTEHHVVSVHRATAIEASQLTQPRYSFSSSVLRGIGFGEKSRASLISTADSPSTPTALNHDSASPTPEVAGETAVVLGDDQPGQRESGYIHKLPLPFLRKTRSAVSRVPVAPPSLDTSVQGCERIISYSHDRRRETGCQPVSPAKKGYKLFHLRGHDIYDSSLASKSDSTWPEEEHYFEKPRSDIPTLDMILCLQEADGEFNATNQNFVMVLKQKYKNEKIEKFLRAGLDHVPSVSGRQAVERLRYNILIVIHITYEHATSKALWELQVAKARRWIYKMFVELLKENDSSEESIEISLEELELSVITELQKQDRQEA